MPGISQVVDSRPIRAPHIHKHKLGTLTSQLRGKRIILVVHVDSARLLRWDLVHEDRGQDDRRTGTLGVYAVDQGRDVGARVGDYAAAVAVVGPRVEQDQVGQESGHARARRVCDLADDEARGGLDLPVGEVAVLELAHKVDRLARGHELVQQVLAVAVARG